MSDSVRPHRRHPPGSPVPGISRQEHWSGLPFPSPMHEGKKGKWSSSVMSDSQWPHGLQLTRLLSPWDFPGKSTGVGCRFFLQGIFPTQGSILGLPHCKHVRWVQLCGSLNILWHCLSVGWEWKLTFSSPVAIAEFSRFAGILSVPLSQHQLLEFEIAQLEFHHLH